MKFRSKAPFRIGLAGGGTDVSPYSDMFGGASLNATISLYAYTTIIPRTDGKIIFRAEDRGEEMVFDSADELPVSGTLDLQIGVYNRIAKDFNKSGLSFEMITSMDVSSGSGLGTSSTLVTSIIGAFVEWFKLPLGEYDIAQLAYEIERVVDHLVERNPKSRIVMQATQIEIAANLAPLETPDDLSDAMRNLLKKVNPEMSNIQAEAISHVLQEGFSQKEVDIKELKGKISSLLN